MIREIIRIDEEKCNGCGNCIPNCHEGALQIIDGKAILVSDLMCDGLGACIGHCPEAALSIEKIEAQPYNETIVMKEMVNKGENVVYAHLSHLKEHGEKEFLKEGLQFLLKNQEKLGFDPSGIIEKLGSLTLSTTAFIPVQHVAHKPGHACPGSAPREFNITTSSSNHSVKLQSALTHWPVQLHLINPASEHFRNADLLVAADCTAFTSANFHEGFLKNKKLLIACPKLDQGLDAYLQKLISLINGANVNTITVLRMEVPCCGGLVQLVSDAVVGSGRKVPVKEIVLGISGEVLGEKWI